MTLRYTKESLQDIKQIIENASKDSFQKSIYKSSERSTISLIKHETYEFIIKESLNRKDIINEAFIGLKCLNLLKTPNFIYTLDFVEDDERSSTPTEPERAPGAVYLEYIKGPTLCEFIKTNPSLKIILEIIVQIMLSLEMAQLRYGFVHNDLMTWNIIVQTAKEPIIIEYDLFYTKLCIKTKYIPCIIDYGKSHVITGAGEDDDYPIHVGIVNPFLCIKGQDVFLLISILCLDLYKSKHISQHILLRFVNFFIQDSPISTVFEALNFLNKYTSYGSRISAYRTLSLDKSPLEFINWCKDLLLDNKIAYGKSNSSLDKNLYSSRKNELLLFKCTLPQPNNKLSLYYAAQQLISHVDINSKAGLFIKKLYTDLIERYNRKDSYSFTIPSLEHRELSIDLFRGSNVEQSVGAAPVVAFDYSTYTLLIHQILTNNGPFKLSQGGYIKDNIVKADRKEFEALLKRLPPIDKIFYHKIAVADNNTFLLYGS